MVKCIIYINERIFWIIYMINRMTLPHNVDFIIEQLNKNGFEAYVVGGCVRDYIMGKAPKDWDITTSASPQQVKAIFDHTVDTGIQHGTVTVMLDKVGYEVTTFRIDGEYEDNRHPKQVVFTTKLEGDLSRRDFTINALAYCHKTGLVDMFFGMEDIKNNVIRGVGQADLRFKEDALRMLRALRFSAQLDFNIEEQTYQAIIDNAPLIKNISVERIRDEITKLIMTDNPEKIMWVAECGLLKLFMGKIEKNITEKNCAALKKSEKNIALRYAILFNNVENADKLLKAFTIDNKTNKMVCNILKFGNNNIENTPYCVRKLLFECNGDREEFHNIVQFRRAMNIDGADELEKIGEAVLENKDCITYKNLAVTGQDIIPLGFSGKSVGEVLYKCMDTVLKEPDKNNKDFLFGVIKQCMP